MRRGGIRELCACPQFCCEPKTAPENKVYSKKKKKGFRVQSAISFLHRTAPSFHAITLPLPQARRRLGGPRSAGGGVLRFFSHQQLCLHRPLNQSQPPERHRQPIWTLPLFLGYELKYITSHFLVREEAAGHSRKLTGPGPSLTRRSCATLGKSFPLPGADGC